MMKPAQTRRTTGLGAGLGAGPDAGSGTASGSPPGGARGSASASDIVADGLLLKLTPATLKPYLILARLDRPIGSWLLLLPCWWSLSMAGAAGFAETPWTGLVAYGALMGIGAVLTRGAGCVWNDILDRDLDQKVARTAHRPLAAGTVTLLQAAFWMGLLFLTGLAVLLQFNRLTIWLGVASLGLVAVYPLVKRVSHWPQAWLGLTFSWGAILGWSAATGHLATPAFLLYAAAICWTISYDTLYAHQDHEDDALVGIRSTAILFGDRSRLWIALFFMLALVFLGLALVAAGFEPAALILVALVGLHPAWQIWRVDLARPENCLAKFRSNKWFGLAVTAIPPLAAGFGAVSV